MKRLIILYIMCLCCTCLFATKRALVIGISEYRDTRWMKPRISAERDIVYVCELLQKTGFQDSDITVLKNRQATKDAIVKAMQDLAKVSTTGDIIYVHFSGHGQLMTDVDGDEDANLFGEKWDETWIPYDASFKYDEYDNGNLHLCDDEIGFLLLSIKKKIGVRGEILVVVDACHSGDSTREQMDLDSFYETVGDTASYASLLPVTRGTNNNFIIEQSTPSTKKNSKKITENWITISACKAYQVNSEMQDPHGLRIGMLTYGIYSLMTRLPNMSNRELEEYLASFMTRNKHPKSVVGQNPQITGQTTKQQINKTFSTQQ